MNITKEYIMQAGCDWSNAAHVDIYDPQPWWKRNWTQYFAVVDRRLAGWTYKEIGADLGITGNRVGQIERKFIREIWRLRRGPGTLSEFSERFNQLTAKARAQRALK